MSEILFQYQKVNPTTWVYLSSLLMIGLYFKFGRFWSVRNLDLVLLMLLAPGLLIAQYGGEARFRCTRLAASEAQQRSRPAVEQPAAEAARPAVQPEGFSVPWRGRICRRSAAGRIAGGNGSIPPGSRTRREGRP